MPSNAESILSTPKMRLVVQAREVAVPGAPTMLHTQRTMGMVLQQKAHVNMVKELPTNGYVVEVDQADADRFRREMNQQGLLVNQDRIITYITPRELQKRSFSDKLKDFGHLAKEFVVKFPQDPRSGNLKDPRKRIDATHEALKAMDPNWFDRGITGKGITVCVVDTGVYPDVEIRDRIVGFDDLVNGRGGVENAYDDNGHGTHVSGLIAADGSTTGGKFKGVAPEANIYAIKVLSAEGAGTLSDIISGLQLAVQNKDRYGIRVLSMSLGGPAFLREKDDLLALAVKNVRQAGIVPVIAAGNEGPGRSTVASPGISTDAITVAACDDKNIAPKDADEIANKFGITYWSSRGPTLRDRADKPNIAGLGNQMVSLRSPGSMLDKENLPHLDEHHLLMSGTSMATPWTAGGIACVIAANPSLTVDDVFAIYPRAGIAFPGVHRWVQGAGLLNVPRAVDMALALKKVAAA